MEMFFAGIFIGSFLFLLSMAIEILVGLVLPGKKGYLKIVKQGVAQGSSEEKERRKFADRLHRLGFRIAKNENNRIEAKRPRSSKLTQYPNACPYSFLPLNTDIRFEEVKSDVFINLSLKMNTFVYRDTGESEYLNAFSDYILSDDFERMEPLKVGRVSNTYNTIMILGLISLGIAVSFYYSLFPPEPLCYSLLLHSLGWAHILASLFSYACASGAKLYPGELRKSVLGFLAPLFTLLSLLFLGHVLHYHYEETKTATLIGYILGGLFIGPFYKRIASLFGVLERMQMKYYQREKVESIPEKSIETEYIGDETLIIHIPLNRNKGTAVFLAVWLIGWVIGELAAGIVLLGYLVSLILHGPLPSIAILFLLVWLTGWSVGGYFAIYAFLWNISAKEILYIVPQVLTIEKRIAWRKKIESYNAEFIRNFRKDSNRKGMRFQNITPECFAFEYGEKTVRFGKGVSGAEADQVVKKVLSFLPSLGNHGSEKS
ncbi:hypothetical protein JW926_04375 [Candidatus Sumerlaeota bacterium]|nr:hypothetical protein [Candidatus Sumerlaeota bacterium]